MYLLIIEEDPAVLAAEVARLKKQGYEEEPKSKHVLPAQEEPDAHTITLRRVK